MFAGEGKGKTRAELLQAMTPQLITDVKMYTEAEGGRNTPAPPGWGCPATLSKSRGEKTAPLFCYDAWPILHEHLVPGDERRVGFVFLSGQEAADVFKKAGIIYLWEGRFVGEAVVVA